MQRVHVASQQLKEDIADAAWRVRDVRQVVNGIDVSDTVPGF